MVEERDKSPRAAAMPSLEASHAVPVGLTLDDADAGVGGGGLAEYLAYLWVGRAVVYDDVFPTLESLRPDRALGIMRAAIEAQSDSDYLYSDERLVDQDGSKRGDCVKGTWSPERLRGQTYTCHLSVLRASLVREAGGFHEGYDGSQDDDLVLRVTERARHVVHIPRVLYHWRAVPGSVAANPLAKPDPWHAGQRAVQAHVGRVGIDADVTLGSCTGTFVLHRRLPRDVRISVIIPTRGSEGIVWVSAGPSSGGSGSLLAMGGHANVEVVVVHDPDTSPPVRTSCAGLAVIRYGWFCFTGHSTSVRSATWKLSRPTATQSCCSNDDIEISSENFLANLVAPLLEAGVGLSARTWPSLTGRFSTPVLVCSSTDRATCTTRSREVGRVPSTRSPSTASARL